MAQLPLNPNWLIWETIAFAAGTIVTVVIELTPLAQPLVGFVAITLKSPDNKVVKLALFAPPIKVAVPFVFLYHW